MRPDRPQLRRACCALALAIAGPLAAQPGAVAVPAERPPSISLERYGLEEGLSQLTVTAIAEDPNGFLWVGTQEGLNRFDSHRFRVFRARGDNEFALGSSSIDALAVDAASRLWVGTNDAGLEIHDLRDRSRVQIDAAAGLSHPTVSQVLVEAGGGAWLGTPAGVERVDAELQVHTVARTAPVVALRRDSAGIAHALDRSCRLWRLQDAEGAAVPVEVVQGGACVGLLPAGDRGWWVATAFGGLLRVEAGGAVLERVPADAMRGTPAAVTALALRRTGAVLVGFADGRLVQIDGGGARRIQEVQLSPPIDSALVTIHEHSSGVLWLGSHTAGLFRARPLSAAIRTDLIGPEDIDAWPGRSVRAIWRSGDDWLIGTDAGLAMRDGSSAAWRGIADIGITSVRGIAADPGGGWWIGTHRGLWWLAPDGRAEPVPGLPDPQVTDLLLEGELLWVATRGGLARFRGRTPEPLPADVARAVDGVFLTSLMRGVDGKLWIASNERGVYRLAPDGALEHLHTGNERLRHDSVWSLHAGPQADWLGTFSRGIHRMDRDSGAVRVYRESDGLPNGVVYNILSDARSRLWFGTNNGLAVLDPAGDVIQAFVPGDGLRNREFNSGAAFRDAAGLLYFGGTEGLDIVAPELVEARSPPARPVVAGLQVLGRRGQAPADDRGRRVDTLFSDQVRLGHRDVVVSLDLVAIDFAAPDAARLRYRIRGIFDEWIEPQGAHTELVLSHLPAGEYPLEVEAAGRDGQFGRARELVLLVSPPPWQHPLAWAGYALLVLAALAWMAWRVRGRVQAERRQIELLNRTVAERTAELEESNRLLVESNVQLELAIRTDPLTQVSNRRDLQDWLDREGAEVIAETARWPQRGRGPYFCMIDIDDFKRINDSYGHQIGDEVLVAFAERLRRLCREGDVLVRWGGEEFLLLLLDVRVEDVTQAVERIRWSLAEEPLVLGSGREFAVTCSIGFAPWPLSPTWPTLGDWDQSVSLADRALYAAKAAGKNAWVGVMAGPQADRSALLSLLSGASPDTLRDGSVQVLYSMSQPPAFERG